MKPINQPILFQCHRCGINKDSKLNLIAHISNRPGSNSTIYVVYVVQVMQIPLSIKIAYQHETWGSPCTVF